MRQVEDAGCFTALIFGLLGKFGTAERDEKIYMLVGHLEFVAIIKTTAWRILDVRCCYHFLHCLPRKRTALARLRANADLLNHSRIRRTRRLE